MDRSHERDVQQLQTTINAAEHHITRQTSNRLNESFFQTCSKLVSIYDAGKIDKHREPLGRNATRRQAFMQNQITNRPFQMKYLFKTDGKQKAGIVIKLPMITWID